MPETVPFDDVYHVIRWFVKNKPGAYKPVNLLEPEYHTREHAEQFSGDHPHDKFASIAAAIFRTFKQYTNEQAGYFFHFYLAQNRLGAEQLAEIYSCTPKTIWKWIARIRDDLAEECARRELIILEDDG